jgi:hypothetical protein
MACKNGKVHMASPFRSHYENIRTSGGKRGGKNPFLREFILYIPVSERPVSVSLELLKA